MIKAFLLITFGLLLPQGIGEVSILAPSHPYQFETFFETVSKADTIVISQLSRNCPDGKASCFKVIEVLKGNVGPFIINEYAIDSRISYDPIEEVNNTSKTSPYQKSVSPEWFYLTIIPRHPSPKVFKPSPTKNSLWIKAARKFLEIQKSGTQMEQMDDLEELFQEINKGANTRVDARENIAFSELIKDHLSAINSNKPFDYLVGILRERSQPIENRKNAIFALYFSDYPNAKKAVMDYFNSDEGSNNYLEFYSEIYQKNYPFDYIVFPELEFLLKQKQADLIKENVK